MRFAFIGAGGVGGYFGAKLVRAGHDVTFIARGAHLRAMRERGLELRSAHGDFKIAVRAEEDAARVGPVDCAILAVKTYDTAGALPLLQAVLDGSGGKAVALSLQNGVESPGQLAATLGEQAVLGGCTYIAASIQEPGVIVHVGKPQRIIVGEVFGDRSAISARAAALRDALAGAGIDAEAVADARVPIWVKFMFLAPFSGFTGAARQPHGVLWADPHVREMFREAVLEVYRVARAEGIPVPEAAVDEALRFTEALSGAVKSSLLVDLEHGRRIEVDALQSAVVRRGRAVGVPTPIMATLQAVLKPYEHGRPG